MVLVFGFWFLVFGFWFLVFSFWLLVFGYWLLVFGYWFSDFKLPFIALSFHSSISTRRTVKVSSAEADLVTRVWILKVRI